TSQVEAVLRRDPAGAYVPSDKATRDRYRHAVESPARRRQADEIRVAKQAIELCEAARSASPEDGVRAHIGYYLVDDGRPELERRGGHPPRLHRRVVGGRSCLPHRLYS